MCVSFQPEESHSSARGEDVAAVVRGGENGVRSAGQGAVAPVLRGISNQKTSVGDLL